MRISDWSSDVCSSDLSLGASSSDEPLGDLDGVEGRALAGGVAGEEQRQAAAIGGRRSVADAPHLGDVAAGDGERVRHVRELDAGRAVEQLPSPLGRDRPLEPGVDRQRVAGEDGHAHAGAGDREVGDAEDLAALVAELLVLVGLAAAAGRSEEHTSALLSLLRIPYAVICLTKNKTST